MDGLVATAYTLDLAVGLVAAHIVADYADEASVVVDAAAAVAALEAHKVEPVLAYVRAAQAP